jgi:glycosyltransferase involved in cell wall biosynthesis
MSVAGPAVTIGIPSYQSAAFIEEAIASALDQDFADLEVLVIDDASTDGTLDVVARFDDPRLRVLRNETNLGAGRNWNRVMTEARGRYMKMMGGDDVLLPGSIAAQVAVLEADPGVVLVTGPRLLVTKTGRRIMRRDNGGMSGRMDGRDAGREMVRRGSNLVGEPCAALMRMSTVRAVGAFDESAPYCIDFEMWLRLLEAGDLYVLDRPVCLYRIVDTSWSAAVADTQDRDVARLLHSTVERGYFGVTPGELALAERRARTLSRGRRIIYHVLFDAEMHRRMRYLVVGGWNTLFGYLAFTFLYFFLHPFLSDPPILVLSYVPAILNAYFGYKRVVFRTDASFIREFPRFAVVYVVALAANILVLPWLKAALGGSAYLGQAAFTVVLVVCTYIVNQRFSFRKKAE